MREFFPIFHSLEVSNAQVTACFHNRRYLTPESLLVELLAVLVQCMQSICDDVSVMSRADLIYTVLIKEETSPHANKFSYLAGG